MVEGYTDVISMHQCGIENVVANSGTALSVHQIRMLHRFTSNITLLYDGDAAGIHAALRGTDMILAEGMNIKAWRLSKVWARMFLIFSMAFLFDAIQSQISLVQWRK